MDIFGGLKFFLRPDPVTIDNSAFRLCTKGTFVILISASLLVTSRQYIGDPIDCIVDGIPAHIMDTFCWFFSTYTLSNRLIGIAGRDMVQPGVSSESEFDDTIKYHRYYQWVCFALFFQAMMCYLPRYIWKSFENNRIKTLTAELNHPLLEKRIKDVQKSALIGYIHEHLNQHNFYAYRFFLCEFLNVAIAVGQFFFTDYFLDGEFWNYGKDMLYSNENDVNPSTRIFPKMTKCTFHKYGPSGSVQKYDGLCVLAVNNINEKLYLFLWFWFIGMCVVSGFSLIYRIFVCLIPKFRLNLLRARGRLASQRDIDYIFHRCEIGDWFLLYLLSKNVDPLIFKEICHDLSNKIYNGF